MMLVYIRKYIKKCVILSKSRCLIKIANPSFVTILNYKTSIYMLNFSYKDSSYNGVIYRVERPLLDLIDLHRSKRSFSGNMIG